MMHFKLHESRLIAETMKNRLVYSTVVYININLHFLWYHHQRPGCPRPHGNLWRATTNDWQQLNPHRPILLCPVHQHVTGRHVSVNYCWLDLYPGKVNINFYKDKSIFSKRVKLTTNVHVHIFTLSQIFQNTKTVQIHESIQELFTCCKSIQ